MTLEQRIAMMLELMIKFINNTKPELIDDSGKYSTDTAKHEVTGKWWIIGGWYIVIGKAEEHSPT